MLTNWIELQSKTEVKVWCTQQMAAKLEICGLQQIPKEIWRAIEAQHGDGGFIDECMTNGNPISEAEAQELLLNDLTNVLDLFRAGQLSTGKEIKLNIRPPELSPYEAHRAEIFSEWLANDANNGYHLKRIRRNQHQLNRWGVPELSQRTLTPSEAIDYLRHQDCRGRPVTMEDLDRYETLSWPPKSIKDVPLVRDDEGVALDRSGTEVTHPLLEGEGQLTASGSRLIFQSRIGLGLLVLDARIVATRYFWTPEQALWFILTGQYPVLQPITIAYRERSFGFHDSGYTRGLVTIKVEPWVSEQTVLAAYAEAKKWARPKKHKSLRDLKAWQFVIRKVAMGLEKTLYYAWNNEHPQETIRHRQAFSRSVKAAKDAVLRPYNDRSIGESSESSDKETGSAPLPHKPGDYVTFKVSKPTHLSRKGPQAG